MNPTRYQTVDHWRGLACLAVLVNHAVWFPGSSVLEGWIFDVSLRLWIGVPIFFVISGYCIAGAVESHAQRRTRPLSTYFVRRIRRIYPPYWIVLLATLLVVGLLDLILQGAPLSSTGQFLRPWWYDWRQWFGNLTLTEIWRNHVIPGQKALMLSHAWTLCYEEQFYALAGILLAIAPGRFFLGSALITIATLAAWTSLPDNWIEGFFFDGSWVQFWFGVVVYFALRGSSASRTAALVLFLAVVAMSIAEWPRLLQPAKNTPQTFFVAALFASLLLMLYRRDSTLAQSKVLAPIRLCGVMCYSLYLVHLPMIQLLRVAFHEYGTQPGPLLSLAVSVPMCLAAAWGFHCLVERRFMNTVAPAQRIPRSMVGAELA